jgi:hypothetical protein
MGVKLIAWEFKKESIFFWHSVLAYTNKDEDRLFRLGYYKD